MRYYYKFRVKDLEVSVPAEDWIWTKNEIGVDIDAFALKYLAILGMRYLIRDKKEEKEKEKERMSELAILTSYIIKAANGEAISRDEFTEAMNALDSLSKKATGK